MMRLGRILRDDELCGCLEADLKRFYQTDLRDLYRSPRTLTRRQVCVWLRHLPSDSALARRGYAGDTKPSLTEKLQVEMVNELRRVFWVIGTQNLKRVSDPITIELEPSEVSDAGS